MSKPWLSQYGEIPAEINPNQFSSIAALYDDAFERFGSRTLAMSMEKTLTVRISRVVYSLIDKSSIEVSHKELSYSTTYGV